MSYDWTSSDATLGEHAQPAIPASAMPGARKARRPVPSPSRAPFSSTTVSSNRPSSASTVASMPPRSSAAKATRLLLTIMDSATLSLVGPRRVRREVPRGPLRRPDSAISHRGRYLSPGAHGIFFQPSSTSPLCLRPGHDRRLESRLQHRPKGQARGSAQDPAAWEIFQDGSVYIPNRASTKPTACGARPYSGFVEDNPVPRHVPQPRLKRHGHDQHRLSSMERPTAPASALKCRLHPAR